MKKPVPIQENTSKKSLLCISKSKLKLELENLRVVQNYLKPKDLKFALEIIKEHQSDFIRIWNEWFN